MPRSISHALTHSPTGMNEENDVIEELKGKNSNQQFVTALARGVAILRCFSAQRTELGTMEIAQLTGLPQPTVWRLCHTLQELGCLTPVPHNGKLCVGMGLLGLGFSALASTDIADLALSEMRAIADSSRAAVSLTIAEPFDMLIVRRAQGNGTLVANLNTGSRISMATSAAGWAYLASLSEDAREAALARLKPRHHSQWNEIKTSINKACKEYVKSGFIINLGVFHPEINSAAVPVCDARGNPVYVINCGAAATTLSEKTLKEDVCPQLRLLSNRMQAALAARGANG
jgi:DNA-binding IclR family transcriptional regulator